MVLFYRYNNNYVINDVTSSKQQTTTEIIDNLLYAVLPETWQEATIFTEFRSSELVIVNTHYRPTTLLKESLVTKSSNRIAVDTEYWACDYKLKVTIS